MKRTYQPKKRQRSKVHGFRKRMASKGGRSVVRNKVRRRMKEIARAFIPHMQNGYNYIMVASPQAAGATFAELVKDMSAALTKAGKLSDKEVAEKAARGE